MDLKLMGRRALVTGSNSGIGKATAQMLAREDCHVVVHGRDAARTEAVAIEIGAAGFAVGDLSSDAIASEVHARAVEALGGPIEILINNAGGGSTGSNNRPPIEISPDEWISNYHANTLSAVRMVRLAVPEMVAAGWGRVVQVSSAVAIQPNYLGSDYSGAKAAMNNFTVSLAGSLKDSGVTVNTVSPGIIVGEGMLRMARQKFGNFALTVPEMTRLMVDEKVFELPPVGRLGTAEDVAVIICTLVSPLAGFITGSNYRVDGGQIRAVV